MPPLLEKAGLGEAVYIYEAAYILKRIFGKHKLKLAQFIQHIGPRTTMHISGILPHVFFKWHDGTNWPVQVNTKNYMSTVR